MVIARRSMFFILLLFIQNQRYVVESKVDKVGYSGTLQAPCLNCTKTMSLDEEQHGKQDIINSSTRRQSSFTLHDETNTTNNVRQATTFTAFVHTIQSSPPAPPPPTIKSRRDTRNKENLIAALRKQLTLKDNKKDEQLMADARLEQNYSAPYYNKMPTDNINVEQDFNKNNNKLRQLHNLHYPMREQGYIMPAEVECTFEESCKWQWRNDIHDGFINTTSADYGPTDTGPMYDADNRTSGHFLLLRITASTKELHVTSPLFRDSPTQCRLEVALYQGGMYQGVFKAVVDTFNHTQWVIGELTGQDANRWKVHKISVGRIKQVFRIILEVVPGDHEAYIAIDNIKLIDCFSDYTRPVCTPHQFRCMHSDICINTTKICDITLDCQYGDDEIQNCDKMPVGARCNFEDDWCGWHNSIDGMMQWSRHNGSTPTNKTGPNFDNTYKNSTGKYLYVNMAESMPKGAGFASSATINSVIFNPPPRVHGNSSSRFYNSCIIRFYYHQYGYHKSGIALLVIEMKPRENITTDIWWSHEDHGDAWLRRTIILPNITHRYYLQFEARKGISSRSDVAIDDFSLSPECFGLNIPSSELNGYNYWDATQIMLPAHKNEPHTDFINATYFEFTTCGARGTKGPTQENCTRAYNNTKTRVEVLDKPRLAGVQKWTPLESGIYTLILFGAGGGKGSSGMGSSRGAMVRTVLELTTADKLYVLVGQEGISACLKSLGHTSNSSCESLKDSSKNLTGIRGVLNMKLKDGGGGGGGATFVFKVNGEKLIPVAIAAGGGGLGLGHFVDNGLQHGQAINMSRPPVTGNMYGPDSAGAGGGWNMFKGLVAPGHDTLMGGALLDGGRGGLACYSSTDGNGNGGFGGGGGGCNAGGGGGGYAGGNAWSKNTTNGEGGYSFLDLSKTIPKYSVARSGQHAGPGMVMLIPAKAGCGCDYRCLPLDVRRSEVVCICPKEFTLDQDGKTCIFAEAKPSTDPKALITILIIIIIILIIAFGALCIILYNRYQHRANGVWRRKMLSGPELQLNRLRVASDSMMTEYNPNYEFGGVVYTLKDLKDIPRDQLRLVKALGQGAFGEVYQGFYRQRSGDAVEMPVAVKTLPEMSTNQAEMDFLMEALIMSKFNHPNIVHFIGVCFDKHPRFIVLELLAGGDLKNFLRESRPKPGRGSSLSMKDLVLISIDVAKGCKYMEDNRFIHRDIAARNCLLTTKGPGRVVKIADFGMSRDIYRSDYYRKGGTAMLPIKWMPPEAFLDGIFTSKTDVWSFGVLLWETMSMGYMPYTGCANRDVMQLVTSGGRLEPPANCPGPLYAIMTQCWHPNPEQRPNFSLILERLGYCAQDPEVMNALLPVFNRPPSNERDTTVMRPEHSDQSYLKVPHAQDYLIPTTNHPTDMQNSVSTSSVDKLITNESDNWETSFVMPHSKSTQPLLQDNEQHTDDTNNSTDKLINMDSPQSGTSEHPIPVPVPAPVPPVQPVVANNTNSNVTTTTTTTTNHNNNTKNDNIKSGISLDACKLAKQNMAAIGNNIGQKKPYVNVNTCTDTTVTGNGVVVQQNGPFSIQTQPAVLYMNNTANRHNDSEISC